jgi:Protein of unknown function (DUF1360)
MTAAPRPRPVRRDAGFGLRFALASLAAWRITRLLAEEDGPADVIVRLRARAGSGQLGELMDCFYCLSVWVAAPLSVTVARRPRDAPLTWLALSGSACLLERLTQPRAAGDAILERNTPAGRDVAPRTAAVAGAGARRGGPWFWLIGSNWPAQPAQPFG